MRRPIAIRRPFSLPLSLTGVAIAVAVMGLLARVDELADGGGAPVPLPELEVPVQSVATPADGAGVPVDVPVDVDALAYVVADAETGEIIAASNADQHLPIGSIAKLMTAHVVAGAGEPERQVTVPALDIAADESNIGLQAGEQQRRDVLVRAMLIASANDAARALAVDVGGSEAAFVEMMNQAAADLGLADTHFANPVGLDDPEQYSTAADLVLLASVVMDDLDLRATVARPSARLHGEIHAATNGLLSTYAGADGVKTGHTSGAGWCTVASATRDGRQVVAVVLGSSSEAGRDAAAAALLDLAFAE